MFLGLSLLSQFCWNVFALLCSAQTCTADVGTWICHKSTELIYWSIDCFSYIAPFSAVIKVLSWFIDWWFFFLNIILFSALKQTYCTLVAYDCQWVTASLHSSDIVSLLFSLNCEPLLLGESCCYVFLSDSSISVSVSFNPLQQVSQAWIHLFWFN